MRFASWVIFFNLFPKQTTLFTDTNHTETILEESGLI